VVPRLRPPRLAAPLTCCKFVVLFVQVCHVLGRLRSIIRKGCQSVSTPGTERKSRARNPDNGFDKGDDFVARFISGAAVGGFAGGVFTGGSGIVPGAVVGGLVGTAVPSVLSAIRRSNNGHKP